MQGLSNHLDRKTENHSNEDIDIERSHLNYDLCEKEGDTLSRMNERLEEVYCMNRKDVNVCCTWIVTLPEKLKDAPDEHQRKFFEKTNDFLTDRYGGEKNVVSANVHNDETTAHMHFAFIPVVWDEKKKREKVSAKIVINRSELKAFHKDLDNHLKDKIPEIYQEGVLNGKTIGLDDIHSIKKYSAEIEKEKHDMAADLKMFKTPQRVFENIDKNAEKKTVGIINKKELVVLPKKDYENLEILSKSSIKSDYRLKNYKSNTQDKIHDLEIDKKELEGKNERLEGKIGSLEREKDLIQSDKIRYERNAIVYKSILEDKEPDLEISQSEFRGRMVIYALEQGGKPKSKDEGEMWLESLEENKENKTIPRNRLEKAIDKLKLFLDKFISRVKPVEFSLDGLKQKDKEIKQEPKRKKSKSHDMEL